ncbi:MAG: dTDP-4-dehydrorhamnose reductase [Bacteroidetes bacterium]|nr:dTDP-4-dehydrorhamnose reductase [Bacteroidota bacterium]
MKKILVTGANGQLGNELRVISGDFPEYQFVYTDIDQLDLTKFDRMDKFLKENAFDVIINCAAYTAVDKAEEEHEIASLVNVEVPEYLAVKSLELGYLLIHLSTDYVFDGKGFRPYAENDHPNPVGTYAKTKLDGENAILFNAQRGAIIRTSWLYSSFGKNFVKTMLKAGEERKYLRVVYDQIGSPTYARDLAGAILTLLPQFLQLEQTEIYHYANEGVASWYDFAIAIMELAGIECKVEAIETKDYPLPAARPHYSVLNKSRIKSLGIKIPYWRDSLNACIQQLLPNKS